MADYMDANVGTGDVPLKLRRAPADTVETLQIVRLERLDYGPHPAD